MKFARAQWDRTGAVLAVVGGLIALLAGWIGTSRSEYVAEQMAYVVSGGLFGIVLVGIGVGLWISADLKDEWRQLRVLGEQINDERESRGQSPYSADSSGGTAVLDETEAAPRHRVSR